jgi:hypothetical protein
MKCVLVQKKAENLSINVAYYLPVLRIRIRTRRIRMFLGLLDPDHDPLFRGMDSDPDLEPSLIKQK